MATAKTVSAQIHRLAGVAAIAVTAALFGAQLFLAEHYAGASAIALARRAETLAISRNAADPTPLKTSTQQPAAMHLPGDRQES